MKSGMGGTRCLHGPLSSAFQRLMTCRSCPAGTCKARASRGGLLKAGCRIDDPMYSADYANSVYAMQKPDEWLRNPSSAYARWQQFEAKGAGRRPFANRSIVQHRAMFERFLNNLLSHDVALASFGTAELEAFLNHASERFDSGTTTRLRYLKLIDRLCRHLVQIGVRADNPAALLLRTEVWPDTEPLPLYLRSDDDKRLQAWINERHSGDLLKARNRAVVALFLGTGITVAELQRANISALVPESPRPYFRVEEGRGHPEPFAAREVKVRPRRERTIGIDAFAVSTLTAWRVRRGVEAPADAALFPGGRATRLPPRTLDRIVKQALMEIQFIAPDMSPRVLRNTYARRQLLAGRANPEVSTWLGLVSQRTVTRIRATIEGDLKSRG